MEQEEDISKHIKMLPKSLKTHASVGFQRGQETDLTRTSSSLKSGTAWHHQLQGPAAGHRRSASHHLSSACSDL